MLIRTIQYTLSRLTGFIANLWIFPPLRPTVFKLFSKGVAINWKEAEFSLANYRSINDFFTRTLRPELRPLATSDLITPVDGTLIQCGIVSNGNIIQAKGLTYSVASLLSENPSHIPNTLTQFRTYYLSPRDCHLIFSPCTAVVSKISHVKGYRYPVREPYISQHPNLYNENERKNIWLTHKNGIIVLSLVSAFNVSDIECSIKVGDSIKKGEPIAKFKLGSSVVLLGQLPSNSFELPCEVTYGSELI